LPAEKCRRLQHVHSRGDIGDVLGLVDIGQDRHPDLFPDIIQNLKTFIHPQAAKGFY
jgi:hypothetical protein